MWAMPDPSRTSGRRVALVEDDASIGESVVAALTSQGYSASWYRDAASATRAFDAAVPDLVLLDAGLPDVDGVSWCPWRREQHRDLPIVMATARDAEIDMIVGLDAGATDYVTKPLSVHVLWATILPLLRTADYDDPDGAITLGALIVEPASYVASVGGEAVDL